MNGPVTRKKSLRRSSGVTFNDKENENPVTPSANGQSKRRDSSGRGSPFTPMQNLVNIMRDKLEHQLSSAKLESNTSRNLRREEIVENNCCQSGNVSPGLAKLRMTPAGQGLKAKQRILEMKHNQTKNNSDKLNIGGGICLWPDMENMRLTQSETVWLVMVNVLLIPVTVWCFYILHGELVFKLLEFTDKLQTFETSHHIHIHSSNQVFNEGVLHWHSQFDILLNDIHSEFDVSLSNTSMSYKSCVLLYIAGIMTLLYFLADNILAQSKLSPHRIKTWVTLLTIIGLWTVLIMKLFVLAQRLERAVENNIHTLSKYLGELVHTDQELTNFHNVLLYWRTCCLPPTSQGILTVMGILPLQDVTYYLQYYSLPIITALLSPIVKLVISLKDIYKMPPCD